MMKKLGYVVVAMCAGISLGLAGEVSWVEGFEAAKVRAKAENKPILIRFVGSDWCGSCIQLEKDVFSREEFQKYAKENLVLMEADYPRHKKQSKEVMLQNEELDREYDVEGYPTVFLLDAEGKKISEDIGYLEEDVAAYVAYLKSLLKKENTPE